MHNISAFENQAKCKYSSPVIFSNHDMKYYLNYISVKKGSLILAGGMKAEKTLNSIEVMSLDSPSRMQLPKFPIQISQCSLFLKNGILMVWGGRKWNYDMNENCFRWCKSDAFTLTELQGWGVS